MPVDPTLFTALQRAPMDGSHSGGGDWFIDSGATAHMASNPGILSSATPTPPSTRIVVGNGATMPVTHVGRASIPIPTSSLELHNVLVSPSLIKNLISVKQLARDNRLSVEFDPFGFTVTDLRTRMALLRSDSTGDLYQLRAPSSRSGVPRGLSASVAVWHARLGHPGRDAQARILNSFFSHVLNPIIIHVMLAVLENMFDCHFLLPILFLLFRFTLYTVMFGPHPFLATLVISTTSSFSMIALTMYRLSRFAGNLTSPPRSLISSHSSVTSST